MTTDAKKFLKYSAIVLGALVIISAIVSLFGAGKAIFGFGNFSAVGENRTYEVTGEITSLEVEISAADFRIETGDSFSVESNLKNLTFRQTADRLILLEKSAGNRSYNGAFLVIYIPEGTVFTELDIFTGAGKFTADSLSAEKLELEFGAGDVNIGKLIATREAEIEGGAGSITIGGGSLCGLALEMGVGALHFTSALMGESSLDLGVGEAVITLLGSAEDYTLELNKGIGDIRLNGQLLSNGRKVGNGLNYIEINGGIGSISVDTDS